MIKQFIFLLAVILAIAGKANSQQRTKDTKLPVSKGLVLDLNADKGLSIEEDSMVIAWKNQAPNPKAIDFKITEEGRTKTIISQEEPGTGRPTLLKNSCENNGHNSLVFKEDELINDNDEAFHGMMTGGGYTWFAVIKPYKQRGPGKINSIYPNAFFGCLRNSGAPQKETGLYAGFWGSFYPDGKVYMGSRNGLNVKVRDGVNTPEVEGPPPAENKWHIIMGRQGSGQDTVLLELFVNDPTEAVNSSDFPVGDVEPSRMAIGTERNAINHQGKESFDGEMARLLMFDHPLSDDELLEMRNHLVKVYGISVNREKKTVGVSYSTLEGLEHDPNGFLRRDNSDIIKVDSLYYVWYSKMRQFVPDLPVVSTIWYATSPDGHTWTERGECIQTGDKSSWDERYAYTPGILVAEGKYYLFYTAQSNTKTDSTPAGQKTAIGIAVSDSPNGPWTKLPSNPVLLTSDDRSLFDSHRVDDASIITRDGKYWFYYKGRQWGKGPTETKMGVAIAEKPEGPYIKHKGNPLVEGNHEVLVWPQGEGVGAMIGMKLKGRESIPFYLMYAEDGIHFEITNEINNQDAPWAPGAYRPEAFTDSGKGQMIEWGLHIGGERPELFLERFDIVKENQ